MSSPEAPGAPKRSPLFGVSRTRIMSLDSGVRKTMQNAIDRWIEKRVEFLESLPDITRQELEEDGLLRAPAVTLPQPTGKPVAAQPQPRQRSAAPDVQQDAPRRTSRI